MRFRPFLIPPAALAAALLAWAPAGAAGALQIQSLLYDRAFSPNGDGIQDSTRISFSVEGGTLPVDSVWAGIYASALHDPAALLSVLADSAVAADTSRVSVLAPWFGRDDLGGLLSDGFYYLYIEAWAGQDSFPLDPPVQLAIDTAGQSFHSLAVEPSPFFTPRAPGAQAELTILFNSPDFEPLLDTAMAMLLSRDPETGTYVEQIEIERDFGYMEEGDGYRSFRFLWDGKNSEGVILDGEYRADLILSDDAGNPPDEASIGFDLDAEAPQIKVYRFGPAGANQTSFAFAPAALPDTLLVRCTDRNGLAACWLDWGLSQADSIPGILQEAQGPDSSLFAFIVPVDSFIADYYEETGSIATHSITIDAADGAGNHSGDLGGPRVINVRLDGDLPPVPIWEATGTHYIQALATLKGSVDELGAKVILFEDSDSVMTVNVDTQFRFQAMVLLTEGSHDWTAVALDEAGNRSAPSTALTLTYAPGPAIEMPGRWRGAPGEKIQVNSAEDARGMTLRIYSLEGELLRRIEAEGGPREFNIEWDLKDDAGSDLMAGLYVLNLCTTFATGEQDFTRKVVAIVRE